MASYIHELPLFPQMERAEERPKGVLAKLAIAISRTIIVTITFAVPVCMLVSGGFWFSDCPQEKYIPIYLLVGGIAYMLLRLLKFVNQYGKNNNEDVVTASCLITLIYIFLFAWFIIGSVWVYRLYEPNYDPKLGPYCNKNLYLFAFWLTTLGYIIIALAIIFICGVVTVFACKEWRRRARKRDTTLQQDDHQTRHQQDANNWIHHERAHELITATVPQQECIKG